MMSEISNKPSSSSVFEFLKNEKCCESDFFEETFLEKTFNSTIGEISDDIFQDVAEFCSNLAPLDDDKNINAIIHEAESLLKKDFNFFPDKQHDPEKSKVPNTTQPILPLLAQMQRSISTPSPEPPVVVQPNVNKKPMANVLHSPKHVARLRPKSPQPIEVNRNTLPRHSRVSKTAANACTPPAVLLTPSDAKSLKSFGAGTAADLVAARERKFCDKSTTPSPTHSLIHSSSWSKERELEKTIGELQEKLKDTEERFQSLKIQHDSLSQSHRILREDHGPLAEESEKLKLDVQHLTECANVLRNELQAARTDRDAALEIQKILRTDLDESRQERKKYQEQTEKDSKQIQDLTRQCKEMERILMRKHPDSVSALIVASKNAGSPSTDDTASANTRKLLELRISQLENDALEQDRKSQTILANVQSRFNSVQSKYETHIGDLETQVLSLQDINAKLGEKVIRKTDEVNRLLNLKANVDVANSGTQTEDVAERDLGETQSNSCDSAVQTDPLKPSSATSTSSNRSAAKKSVQPHHSNRLAHSESSSQGDAHLMATIRGMRLDLAIKEKAVQRLTRELDECKKTIKKLQRENKDGAQKSLTSSTVVTPSRKVYDSAQYAESYDTPALKDAQSRIRFLEKDYKILHEKRLSDLKTLQAAHEKELEAAHETIGILQQQLSEKENQISNDKRRSHQNVDYYALKAKVSSLERRHSEREKRLHLLVEALSQGKLQNMTNNGHHF